MGNLEKAGIGVVVVLLAVIMIVAFVTDPSDTKPQATTEGDGHETEITEESRLASQRSVDSEGPGADLRGEGEGRPVIDDIIQNPNPQEVPPSVPPGGENLPGEGGRMEDDENERGRPIGPHEPDGPGSGGELVIRSPEPPAAAPGETPKEVEVRNGDSPWKIAERVYGARLAHRMAPQILAANGITDPLKLRVGARLKLPEAPVDTPAPAGSTGENPVAVRTSSPPTPPRTSSSDAGFPAFDPGPTATAVVEAEAPVAGEARVYVVRHGDALSLIAQRELGSAKHIKAIMKLNGLADPNKIREGMRLKLPAVNSSN